MSCSASRSGLRAVFSALGRSSKDLPRTYADEKSWKEGKCAPGRLHASKMVEPCLVETCNLGSRSLVEAKCVLVLQ